MSSEVNVTGLRESFMSYLRAITKNYVIPVMALCDLIERVLWKVPISKGFSFGS